ncbi:3',5'-cyclic-nucleotide phosphodiesterase [Thalassotalea euphylliae]|uniref:3',5'-cyclic-nucleotide phosphodiesterase n=1 Tax=Thalassotalea euphylliae TaxID=1655234 RepID=A0A3E0TTF2_9GAMM|nr:metallophosphoesterase [Thalassotalea euphylliae]REL27946.1 3',5'-cyclic-nucleotide phosphodiesterase [Thalassotalea euphylliae]
MTSNKTITIAQFSDSHLFADKLGAHHGANVYQNLRTVCHDIADNSAVDVAVFTGDLTQDHTLDSYQRFKEVVGDILGDKTVYFLAGNHDDMAILDDVLCNAPFAQTKRFSRSNWQFHLLDSTSDTPAGYVDIAALKEQVHCANQHHYQDHHQPPFQFCFMHHHPIDVGYFIDRHGLTNQDEFWQQINSWHALKGIACGHVHRDIDFPVSAPKHRVPVYTCPATSIKFARDQEHLVAESGQPGYRLFDFHANGEITSQVIYL